jgi:TRAP-type C4-dicarboxylate transport system permease small subunit
MFWRLYDRATMALLALTGGAMFAIAIVNALLRYLLASPLIWAEELSRYFMILGTLVGVALAYRAGQHVAITLLADAVPGKALALFRVACHVIVLATCALLIHAGWVQVVFLGAIAAPSSGLAMGWIYAAIPLGAAMTAIEALRCLGADLKSAFRTTAP